MARTLSDALIIAMIEATTRLASARSSGAKPPSAEGTDAPKDGASKEAPESRTAEQLGDDFATIYKKIEDVVRVSAEQETKTVGFSVR
ncbi:MAG: hypothetical protein ACKO2D_11755 [Chloroflexota bacterium]|jgi:hypothetical protein|nr:hypothetical protein [Chloroflexota bacterium]NCA13675.1 hypothetical protein [Pseudomonadota bacterium]